jgi:hypothetical protein
MPIDRYRVTALHPVAVLSNPHSPNLCAAPRFSPTRFILPSLLPKSFRNLIASRLWGIKRYTLAGHNFMPTFTIADEDPKI